MAEAALVLGVVGAVVGLIPILGLIALPLGVLAVIFGFIGRRRESMRGLALAGDHQEVADGLLRASERSFSGTK